MSQTFIEDIGVVNAFEIPAAVLLYIWILRNMPYAPINFFFLNKI